MCEEHTAVVVYLLLALIGVGVGTGCDRDQCDQGKLDDSLTVTTPSIAESLVGHTEIVGDLVVKCPTCESLSEMECLEEVGGMGSLVVRESDQLTNLQGLNNVEAVDAFLSVGDNKNLTSLDGLSGLTSTGLGLYLWDNDSLIDTTGLSGASSMPEIQVMGNPKLPNLDGLSGLHAMSWLSIYRNDALADLDGLSALTIIHDRLGVYDNLGLPDCEVCDLLAQLETVPEDIDVHDNLDDSCTPVPDNCPGWVAAPDGGK